jgi:hypothetical protein
VDQKLHKCRTKKIEDSQSDRIQCRPENLV